MSIRFLPLMSAAALLAACQPGEQTSSAPPAAQPVPQSQPQQAITAASGLVGEYRVAGADGQDIDLPHGITAAIDQTTIRVAADCLNFAWNYRFESSRLVTEATPVRSCKRGLLPAEEAVRAAFDAAETVSRTPANGIMFAGGGRKVTLFSQ